MRLSVPSRRIFALASTSVVAVLAACSTDEAGGAGSIAFHGEAPALPGFSYDTGLIPASSPAQISLKLSAGGPLLVDAEGTVSGGKLAGKPQSGHAKLDVHVKLEGRLKVDTALKKADGPIPGLSNIDIPIVADVPFDPFLLDGSVALVTADVPETKLPDIPLGSVPGSLQLTIVAGSKVTAKYTGRCMAIAGGQATHTGSARVGGTLIMKGAIALDLPAPLNKVIELAQFSIPIPETERVVPFGPVAVSSVDDGTAGPACDAPPGGVTPEGGATPDGGVTSEDGSVIIPDGATCSASTCSGCCRDGVCLSGRGAAACGKPGEACESCSGQSDCVDRECKVTACGPDNCSGCCEGGVCLLGDSTASCGRAGAACASCGASASCSGGACVSASCKSTCTSGCCTGSTCNPGNTTAACGKSGDACTACGSGRTCTAGACVADPARPFDLVIVSATLPVANKSGSAWDVLGGLPDPFAKVVAGARNGQSPAVSDTRSPTWNYVALSNVPARDLLGPVTLEVWDEDLASNDLMGGCALRFADPDFSGALRNGSCAASATGVAFTFTYKLIPK